MVIFVKYFPRDTAGTRQTQRRKGHEIGRAWKGRWGGARDTLQQFHNFTWSQSLRKTKTNVHQFSNGANQQVCQPIQTLTWRKQSEPKMNRVQGKATWFEGTVVNFQLWWGHDDPEGLLRVRAPPWLWKSQVQGQGQRKWISRLLMEKSRAKLGGCLRWKFPQAHGPPCSSLGGWADG